MKRLTRHLRRTFLAGVFAAIPLAATVLVVLYIETTTRDLFRIPIPFVGVVLAVAAIYLLGLLVTSLVGRYLLGLLDRVLDRMPVMREVYQAWKQISLASRGKEGIFSRVVLIPDETGQMRTLGFTSGDAVEGLDGEEEMCCVFVPTAPNPTSGRLYVVPRSRCRFLKLSREEAFKIVLSSGNYAPALLLSEAGADAEDDEGEEDEGDAGATAGAGKCAGAGEPSKTKAMPAS